VNLSTKKLVTPQSTYFYVPLPKDEHDPLFRYAGYDNSGRKDLSPQWTDPTFSWYTYHANTQLSGEVVYVMRFRLPASIPWAAAGKRTVIQW
jgi:hypothetical protein